MTDEIKLILKDILPDRIRLIRADDEPDGDGGTVVNIYGYVVQDGAFQIYDEPIHISKELYLRYFPTTKPKVAKKNVNPDGTIVKWYSGNPNRIGLYRVIFLVKGEYKEYILWSRMTPTGIRINRTRIRGSQIAWTYLPQWKGYNYIANEDEIVTKNNTSEKRARKIHED